jgi:tetratricopeptide (TPR) repeat protein
VSTTRSARAVELLLDEAWAAIQEGRYPRAVATAERAVRAAEQLDDPALLVRALEVEEIGLLALGDAAAALVRCTRVLTLAGNPAAGLCLAGRAARSVAQAYIDWVDSTLYLTGIPIPDLYEVLDAAERWLIATGHPEWRAGVLLMRALVHERLGDLTAAIAAAEEALAAYRPGAPGTSLAGHRSTLGDILRHAGRHRDADPHYQAVLDDPDSTSHSLARAHIGLAYCALGTGDHNAACQHATTAVSLAEPLGGYMQCSTLDALAAAARACGDLDTAWHSATRHLDAATRIGGHYRPYYATLTAVDVALDRGDLDTARRLLVDLDRHAAALDTAAGTNTHTKDTAWRRRRLAKLDKAVP